MGSLTLLCCPHPRDRLLFGFAFFAFCHDLNSPFIVFRNGLRYDQNFRSASLCKRKLRILTDIFPIVLSVASVCCDQASHVAVVLDSLIFLMASSKEKTIIPTPPCLLISSMNSFCSFEARPPGFFTSIANNLPSMTPIMSEIPFLRYFERLILPGILPAC